jgi:hypothetical protein
MVYADAVQDATTVTLAKEGSMPSASKDEIIDLTDIVEEGHPETPNLKTAKPSAAADETLDDLDLEREIDQIFADLDPPEQDDQGGASGKKGEADSDTLDLDGLFDVQDGNASEASGRTEGPGVGNDSALDFAEDFEKIFDEQAHSKQSTERESNASTEAAAQSQGEPDWLAELGGLGLDEANPQAASAPTDASRDVPPDISDTATTASEMKAETDIGGTPNTEPEADLERKTILERDLGTTDEVLEDVSSVADNDPNEYPALDKVSTPESAISEATSETALPESVLQRLQELEDRLVALENREPPQVDVPGPDLDGLLAQMDERITVSPTLAKLSESQSESLQALETRLSAIEQLETPQPGLEGLLAQMDERITASPALAKLSESQSESLQALETRLSAIEQLETPQPDLEGLLAQVDQRIEGHVGSRFDTVLQAVDNMAEQAETAAAKVVDTELVKLSESISSDIEQRLKERLEERLEELRTSMQEDIEQKLASGMNELKQDNAEQEASVAPSPDGWRDELVALLDERLESLGMELRKELRKELTDAMDKAVPLAAARIIREEIQAMSQEEEGAEQ